MLTVYVLAHFDDEFGALPLILRDQAAGRDMRFLFNMDYRTRELAERRHGETRAFLTRFGIDPDAAIHLGAKTGVVDGRLYTDAPKAYAALKARVLALGKVDRLVTLAWEGGHPDHDLTAAMAVKLAGELGIGEIEQVSLYNSPDLPWLLYHGFQPLPQNGPVQRMRVSAADWRRWVLAVADYPSQAKTWLGLWPALIWTFAKQGEFRWQTLAPGRIAERPHPGRLFYERMFKVPYEAVRAAADSLQATS
jgi:N-acetylglucosamine malate deacetylase 1